MVALDVKHVWTRLKDPVREEVQVLPNVRSRISPMHQTIEHPNSGLSHPIHTAAVGKRSIRMLLQNPPPLTSTSARHHQDQAINVRVNLLKFSEMLVQLRMAHMTPDRLTLKRRILTIILAPTVKQQIVRYGSLTQSAGASAIRVTDTMKFMVSNVHRI